MKKYIPILIVVLIIAIVFLSPLREWLSIDYVTNLISQFTDSPWGIVVFGLLYILAVVLVVPGLPMTLLAAPLFGLWNGILIVVIASNIGTTITFWISRLAGKDFVTKILKNSSFVDKINDQMDKNGFIYMLYLRMIPLFPFNVVNYIPGLTSISYKKYALASFIGMLPGSCIYVYAAYTASDIQNNPWGIIISVGILAAFTLITTKVMKKNKASVSV